jgi:hypothetical protein
MSVVERPMYFLKALASERMPSLVAAAAAGTAILSGIYLLGPEIGSFPITIAASLFAFAIGRAFSSHNWPTSLRSLHGRAWRHVYRTAPSAARKRPVWLTPIPLREMANGNFRVEDWQHGEYA